MSATIFNNTVDNLIEFNNDTFVYEQNNGSTETSGLELSSNMRLGNTVNLNANYTYTTSETGNVQAVRVPKHDLVLQVKSQLSEKFSSLASLRVARDIEDTVWPSNVKMPNYEVLDLSFTYDINGKTSAYLQVQNVADENYETIKGYNTGGRQFFAGIVHLFRLIAFTQFFIFWEYYIATENNPKVVSLNVCTDQFVMLLADDSQIISLSEISTDILSSAMAEEASKYHQNNSGAEEVYLLQPDIVFAGIYTAKATVNMLESLGIRVEKFEPANTIEQIILNMQRTGKLLGILTAPTHWLQILRPG